MTIRLRESCPCGATFSFDSDRTSTLILPGSVAKAVEKWRAEHQHPPQPEPYSPFPERLCGLGGSK